VLVKGVKEYSEKLLSHIPELDPDIQAVKLNVQVDHVHMVMVAPPKYGFARVVDVFAILFKVQILILRGSFK
jgi:REP element-mobilizing transposase RayT